MHDILVFLIWIYKNSMELLFVQKQNYARICDFAMKTKAVLKIKMFICLFADLLQ